MPLVKATCTNCGGSLEVDNANEAAVCPYCGQAYIVEKAIQQFQVTNQNHIENAYFVNDEYERLKEAADFLLSKKDYDGAYAKYSKIQADYPQKDDKDTVNLLKAATHNWNFDYYINSITLEDTKVLDLVNVESVDSKVERFTSLYKLIPEEERPEELKEFYNKLIGVQNQLADKVARKVKNGHLLNMAKYLAVAAVFVVGIIMVLASQGNEYPGFLVMLGALIVCGRLLTINRVRPLKTLLTAVILAAFGFLIFFISTEVAKATGAFSILGAMVVAAKAVLDFIRGIR